MIKFYVLNDDAKAVAVKGFPLAYGLRAVNAGAKHSWNVTDHRSGITLVKGLKSIPTCVAWAKNPDNKAAIDALSQREGYADAVAAVKAAKAEARKTAKAARATVKPEVVGVAQPNPTATDNAVEVASTPVVK